MRAWILLAVASLASSLSAFCTLVDGEEPPGPVAVWLNDIGGNSLISVEKEEARLFIAEYVEPYKLAPDIEISAVSESLEKISLKLTGEPNERNRAFIAAGLNHSSGRVEYLTCCRFEPSQERLSLSATHDLSPSKYIVSKGRRLPCVSETRVAPEKLARNLEGRPFAREICTYLRLAYVPRYNDGLLGSLGGGFSFNHRLSGMEGGVTSITQRSPQHEQAKGRQTSRTDEHSSSPERHVLLGLQIVVGCLFVVIGLQMIRHTDNGLGRADFAASLAYFLGGAASFCFGILLISGIGIVYFRVL
jgi:hypothetical protein